MQWKLEKKKIPISTSLLQDFITHCKSNIESAKSHLAEEKRREKEAQDVLDAQREAAEIKQQEEAMKLEVQKAQEEVRQAERDRKVRPFLYIFQFVETRLTFLFQAEARMKQVEQLRADWEREMEAKKAAAEKRKKGKSGQGAPDVEEESGLFDDQLAANDNAPLFEDSDDDDDDDDNVNETNKSEVDDARPKNDSMDNVDNVEGAVAPETTEKELFGDSSSDESDDELIPTGMKRAHESHPEEDEGVAKKRRVLEDEDE